jgi:hypothetical protein
MYTYAHPIEDALENITHSICTLEFEDQRPFYDWLLERLAEGGCCSARCRSRYEFARLNLTYVVLSKRKLIQLVDRKHVERLGRPAHADAGRRAPPRLHARGLPPVRRAHRRVEGRFVDRLFRARGLHARRPERTRATPHRRARSAEAHHRQLPGRAGRGMLRAQPSAESRTGASAACPSRASCGSSARTSEVPPPKGYFRLFPGNKVRLKYGFVVECTGCDKDARATSPPCTAITFPTRKSGTPGADTYKVKGNIHWVSAAHAYTAEVRLYDRLFKVPHPGAGDRDRRLTTSTRFDEKVTAQLEPALREAKAGEHFQFERHGYFVRAVLGALANAGFAFLAGGIDSGIDAGILWRFAVGLSLAGVYPLGMKLVVSWEPERAGAALAWLVGMLTLGTALPQGIRALGAAWPWQYPILAASALAVIAAVLILRLGDGPHLKRGHGAPAITLGGVFRAFQIPEYRASALGYFGHQGSSTRCGR